MKMHAVDGKMSVSLVLPFAVTGHAQKASLEVQRSRHTGSVGGLSGSLQHSPGGQGMCLLPPPAHHPAASPKHKECSPTPFQGNRASGFRNLLSYGLISR